MRDSLEMERPTPYSDLAWWLHCRVRTFFSPLNDGVKALSQFTGFRPDNTRTVCIRCRVLSFDSDGQFPGGRKEREREKKSDKLFFWLNHCLKDGFD